MQKYHLANAYAQVGLESAVLSASQNQLTSLLFDGALNTLARAKISMENNATVAKGQLISKAINIIEVGLIEALEPFSDDPLAVQLLSLFDYTVRQLMLANLHNDVEKLQHCQSLLQDIASAWQASQLKPTGT